MMSMSANIGIARMGMTIDLPIRSSLFPRTNHIENCTAALMIAIDSTTATPDFE